MPVTHNFSSNTRIRSAYVNTNFNDVWPTDWTDHPDANFGWSAETTDPAIGNGTLESKYCQVGNVIYWGFRVLAGSTTTFGTGVWKFIVPVGPMLFRGAANVAWAYDNGTSFHNDVIQADTTSQFRVTDTGTLNQWGPTVPFTWTTNDQIKFLVIYAIA